MKHFNWKHIGAAIAAFALASVALLWSWNTVAELFGAPVAEFRHVLATLVLATVVKFVFSSRRTHRRHAH